MRISLAALLLLQTSIASAADPPSILNNTEHESGQLQPNLVALGIAATHFTTSAAPNGTLWALNQTCPYPGNGYNGFPCGAPGSFYPESTVIEWATNFSQQEYPISGTTPLLPTAAYQVINQSSGGYTTASDDQANYTALTTAKIVYSMAYCGTPAANDYPPVAFVTVLPNLSPGPTPIGPGPGCGYGTGIEFSIPATCNSSACSWSPVTGAGSLDVSSPSATTEAMSTVLASLKYNHPSWNWGDVKSVLRATASGWRTGYAPYNSTGPAFGYGNVDYAGANTYSGTIFLQPPGMVLQAQVTYAQIYIYPFNSSRRSGEVIYVYSTPPVFPSPTSNDEYTYSQISTLATTYGGALAFSSSGASGKQGFLYSPLVNTTVYFVAFTVDNIGNLSAAHYSRGEVFSTQSASFTVTYSCLRQ